MIVAQKSIDGGASWIDWDTFETVEKAIGTVKQYALGDKAAFRVVDVTFIGTVVAFEWGPFVAVQPVSE